jgi:hypothetical protein
MANQEVEHMRGMEKEVRAGLNLTGEVLRTTDERYGNAPERQIWQAHVEKEEERRGQQGELLPNDQYYAEQYAARAMSGVDASPNEFQEAEKRGEHHDVSGIPEEIASASDIAGG